ncbi:MAG: adenine methylase [Burkholderiaceae bacterium]|nr:adenine methylase [Burkholderiaceae bacterium]
MKPFLKWAGGKFRIRTRIMDVLPKGRRLIEPFAGSAAVFLTADYPHYLLADSNADLINLFRCLKHEGDGFVGYCNGFFTARNNTPEGYGRLRALFNSTPDHRLKAALFVYLNRHCFNGLCRYNRRGEFNVPFGKYSQPGLPAEQMRAFSQKAQQADFAVADFRTIMQSAREGDVVYCDPPYVPLSATSNFTDYAAGGFGLDDQRDLAQLAQSLREKGIPVVISNHDTDWTRQHYHAAKLFAFDVRRSISANGAKRGNASELLAVFD